LPELVPLPPQPADVPWPSEAWPRAEPAADVDSARLEAVLAGMFAASSRPEAGATLAMTVVHRGVLVAERYGADHGPAVPLCSWSVAKSITHALVGIRVRDGKLDPTGPAPVPAWQHPDDPRRTITLEHLLRMSSGLRFLEDYVDEARSDCIRMLFGEGRHDVAGYAEACPLEHPPGRVWSYASGTTNVLSAIVARSLGGGREIMRAFMRRELFDRLGMRSADPRFDTAGSFVGSSFVFAKARDFARFGLLYLRDGVWEGERILPRGWVDAARTPTPGSGGEYGAHWWLALDGSGRFAASGYRGQYVVVDPARDLVMVRLGDSTPEQRGAVLRALLEVVVCFPRR
jgi:CubicO group peptidase (beta-lactamase class C family)